MVTSIQLHNAKYLRIVDTYDGTECTRLINSSFIVDVEIGNTAIVFSMVDGRIIEYTDLNEKQIDAFHKLLGYFCL